MEQVAQVDPRRSRWHTRRIVIAGVLLCVAVGVLLSWPRLCQCPALVTSEQLAPRGLERVTLTAGTTLGQTFVSQRAGLAGIELSLRRQQAGEGEIRLHLRADPRATVDLAAANLPLATIQSPGRYRLMFTPQSNSWDHDYYLLVELVGAGQVEVEQAPADAYLGGALYQNGEPREAQLSAALIFDVPQMLLGYAREMLGWLWVGAVAALIYVLPGWALLALLWPGFDARPALERLSLAGGVGVGIYPLLLLWSNIAGVQLGALHAWLPIVAALAVVLWRARGWRPSHAATAWRAWPRTAVFWPDLLLVVLVVAIVALRFRAIRALDVPMWGDSYQHTMIAQLLLDHGGLFDAWQPYVPYASLTVQFGFPAAVAAFSWVTGADSVAATLWVGQILIVLAVLSIYPLALRITHGNRWAGVGALLVAGLLSFIPSFYVNWGRYAQLAGQVALPALLWLLCDTLERERTAWREPVLIGIVAVGMLLSYYRMAFYAATFVLAWLIGWGLPYWRADLRRWGSGLARLVLSGVVTVVLFVPWGLHAAGGRLGEMAGAGVRISSPLDLVMADYAAWRSILLYIPWFPLALAVAGLVLSLALRRWHVVAIGLWTLALSSIVAGQLIRLPGANLMQSFAVIIALYIPVGLLAGWLLAWTIERAGPRATVPVRWLASAGLLAAIGWALWFPQEGPSAPFIMVTRPDMRAMAWIRENTAPDARFLVEGFRVYAGSTAVGSDAGWWIPLLAGHPNTMPPQYALLSEQPSPPDYTQRVVDLVAQLEREPPTAPQSLRLLCDWRISYVYIGQGQGQVGVSAPQLFAPQQLIGSPAFSRVYRQDRVSIFQLRPELCETSR